MNFQMLVSDSMSFLD